MMRSIFAHLIITIALLAPYVGAQELATSSSIISAPRSKPVTLEIVSEKLNIQPGETISVALDLKLGEHWHAYWKNPGDAGMAPEVTWNLPEGFTVGPIIWPTPKRFELDSAVGFGYENELILLAEVTAPKTPISSPVTLGADVSWVVCNDQTCLPGESHAEVVLAGESSLEPSRSSVGFFEKARGQIPLKSNELCVKRKGGHIEIGVPRKLLSSKVTKVEFFPDQSTLMLPSLVPHWIAGKGGVGGILGSVVLPEVSKDAFCKGIVVLYHDSGCEAYEISAPLNDSDSDEIAFNDVPLSKIGALDSKGITDKAAPVDDFEFQGGLLMALVLAFIGGMILNLMPCVLPVISFKILGFVKLAGESRALVLKHGLAFCVGVLVSFWALAALLLVLQAYGHSVGWGFQLQEPIFIAILASIVFIFALSLFGVFEIGTSLISAASQGVNKAGSKGELTGSFFSGVLATAVATPCTGPFLGSAVGFAVTLPPVEAMLIFTMIGLGMSLPYLALSAFPSLLRFMPRPGAWMETFKQLMGFMMVATSVWLLWVFGAQTGSFSIMLLLAAFFIFSVAAWVYGRFATPVRTKQVRLWSTIIAGLILVCGCFVAYTATTRMAEAMSGITTSAEEKQLAAEWEEYSPERVVALRSQGIPVFVDFTAKWCLICQMNHLVLTTEEVAAGFVAKGVVRMKADWTKRDELIAGELKKLGRNSVPLYVLYSADIEEAPQILPQVLTRDIVLSSLEPLETR